MSSDRPEPRGFIMALVLSIMFLIISACADVEPTVDPSMNMHAEDEAIAKLRTSAEGGDATAQNQLGLLYYEGTGDSAIDVSDQGQPYIQFKDESDTDRVWIGISSETGLAVQDVDGKTRLVLSVDQEGKPSLVVRDRERRTKEFHP